MLQDFTKNIVSNLTQRIASPLSSSFIVAWTLWNYKFIVILLSNNTITTTFSLIEQLVFPTNFAVITNGIVYPIITTIVYIFVYPYPARFVYRFTRERQREISLIKQQIDDETPLTKSESRELKSQFRKLQHAHFEEVDSLENDIKELRAELASKADPGITLRALASRETNADKVLSPAEVELLTYIGQNGSSNIVNLKKISKRSPVETEYFLEELKNGGYIRISGAGSESTVTLAQRGRKSVIDSGLDLV
jgi:predicted transcriptional regulator